MLCVVLSYLRTLNILSVRLLTTMHVTVMQADASALQQELQGLRCSTAQTEKQLQNDITSLQGQLGTALAASHQEISSLGGQLGTALADSAEVCPSPATLTFSDLAVNQLLCPSLKWCMILCVTLCTPFTKLWCVAKLPCGFWVALLRLLMHKLPLVYLTQFPVLFSVLFCLQALLPHSCSCWSAICHGLIQDREEGVSLQLRQAEDALTNGEADRQALISQHAAALEQQGQRIEALEKQLQKLQEVERGSRQEVEKLSLQLYIKRPQVTLVAVLALLICFSVQFNPPLCICHVGTCMKRNRKTTPFTLIFIRSQVLYRAAQVNLHAMTCTSCVIPCTS